MSLSDSLDLGLSVLSTYQGCEIFRVQGVEIVAVEGVGDLSRSSIGKCDGGGWATNTNRHAAFITVGWIHSPIPVRQANFVCCSHSLVAGLSSRVLSCDIDSTVVKDLFEESKIRSVPRTEHVAPMRTVSHHILAIYTFCVVPLSEWNTMYP